MNTLVKNATIVTVDSNMSLIKNGCIGIENNIIKFVKGEDSPEVLSFHADKVIDAKGKIAMPGLVNAHTHVGMTVFRCFGDDLPLNTWLFDNIIPKEADMTTHDLYWGTQLGILEQIKSGITCFAEMYLFSETIYQAVSEAKIRANISGSLKHSVFQSSYQDRLNDMKINKISEDGLLKKSVAIHSIYTSTEDQIREQVAIAKETGTGIHIHISEALPEKEYTQKLFKTSSIIKLEELGLFDVDVLAAHCVHLTETDLQILKDRDVSVAHCPTSNLKLGSGIADVPKMLKKGINVCIGTDGAASNNNLNMIEEMHLTSLLHKGHKMDPLCVNAKETIRMATINGAKAVGFKDEIGVIEAGRKADIILIDVDKPHLTPLNNPFSAIVYSMQGNDVDTVIVNGEVLMENREMIYLDEDKIKYQVKAIAGKFFK